MAFSQANKFGSRQGAGVSQNDLFRESIKQHGRGTPAHFDAMDAIKVTKVSAAREFEDFRQLPKFTHKTLAVIHPSPIKRMAKPRRPSPDFEVQASPTRMVHRPTGRHEIPESLLRPPVEISAGRKSRPKSSLGFGSSQPRWGKRLDGGKAVRKSAAEIQEQNRANAEAEKLKIIN